jgi:hypothetical protein
MSVTIVTDLKRQQTCALESNIKNHISDHGKAGDQKDH